MRVCVCFVCDIDIMCKYFVCIEVPKFSNIRQCWATRQLMHIGPNTYFFVLGLYIYCRVSPHTQKTFDLKIIQIRYIGLNL